ncbi:MAG: hypothetical protein NTZ62_09235 [Actinobacteria bacterium]|nr:hypothetical protein [Actinomycetota bacterium]
MADVAVRDVATGRGVGGTVVEVVEVVEGTVVVVTIGATVVVVTIDTTVVVETNEGTTVVVGATRTGAAVVDVVEVVEVVGATVVDVVVTPVVPVLGEALEALSKTGTAPITEAAITGNLTVKSVWLFAQFARTLTTNSLVRL